MDTVILIAEDLHNERAGYFRAFVASSADADTMSPLIGYASAGGSHRTVAATVAEARRTDKVTPIYRAFRSGRASRLLDAGTPRIVVNLPQMSAKDFNAELCAGILNRLNAQHAKGKITRQKRAIEILCGAALSLHLAKSEHYNNVSWLAIMVATRGMDVVEKTARGEPL